MTGMREEVLQEAKRSDCFLCRPNAALLGRLGRSGYLLAGLGPLADGYAVVASHAHLRGLKDAGPDLRLAYSNFAAESAQTLAEQFGACFVVEHGNMAVCGIPEEGREHCFHPHFLLIPASGLSVEPFLDYFGRSTVFETLHAAIEFGIDKGQYVLAGHSEGPFHVFLPDGELPRQFARGLVAEQLDQSELASWRDQPNLAWTLANAELLKEIFTR